MLSPVYIGHDSLSRLFLKSVDPRFLSSILKHSKNVTHTLLHNCLSIFCSKLYVSLFLPTDFVQYCVFEHRLTTIMSFSALSSGDPSMIGPTQLFPSFSPSFWAGPTPPKALKHTAHFPTSLSVRHRILSVFGPLILFFLLYKSAFILF